MSVSSVQQQQQQQQQHHQALVDQNKRTQEAHHQAQQDSIDQLADVSQENKELRRKEDYKHGQYSSNGSEIVDYAHLNARNDPD